MYEFKANNIYMVESTQTGIVCAVVEEIKRIIVLLIRQYPLKEGMHAYIN